VKRTRIVDSLVLFVGAAAILATTVRTYVQEFSAADVCLDRGGSFDYTRMVCDHQLSHPFVPFSTRHPGLIPWTLAVAAGTALVLILLILLRGRHRTKRVQDQAPAR
jgi:hypothetical protein